MAHISGRAALGQAVPRVSRHLCAAAATGGGPQLQRREPGDLSGVGPSPWPDLPIEQIYGTTKALRIRQHVNPLRTEHQTPKQAPDWAALYVDPRLPLVLDVGCAGGRFALALAHRRKQHNFLGLDIRHQLIERANAWAAELDLERRVAFMQANATISLESLLSDYPGALELCTIQFPDPHFKKRHKKRRIVQPQLISALAALMPAQGRVLLQSDVEEVTAAMRDEFEQFGAQHFALAPEHGCEAAVPATSSAAEPEETAEPQAEASRRAEGSGAGTGRSGREAGGLEAGLQWHRAGYLAENPLGVPTEREVQTLKCGDSVFRVLLVRR